LLILSASAWLDACAAAGELELCERSEFHRDAIGRADEDLKIAGRVQSVSRCFWRYKIIEKADEDDDQGYTLAGAPKINIAIKNAGDE
jgi:hypothetical protein